ncbi:MAG: glycosyltransferase family 4 protein [Pseudomonadota bacterium]
MPTAAGSGPRVLVVGNYAPDGQYSMRLYARELVANLRALGVDARLSEPPAIAARLSFSVRPLVKLAGYIDKYLLYPALLWWQSRGFDWVHIGDHSNAPYRIFVAHRRVLITCHDLFAVRTMLGLIPGQAFGFSGRLLQRWVLSNLRRTPDFVCVSEASAADLRALVGERPHVTIISNALAARFFAPEDARADAASLRRSGVDPDARWFLHVGGNQYYKNRPNVVRLFERLAAHSAFAEHRLVLAGKVPDAHLREAVEQSPLRERIDVLVEPDDRVVQALYRRAAVFLFPSLSEGFGWPILEAQASGCPVATTDAEPMRSVAGGAAILIDPAALDQAADRIVAAAGQFDALREAGRANASAYRPDAIYPRYLPLYHLSIEGAAKDATQ